MVGRFYLCHQSPQIVRRDCWPLVSDTSSRSDGAFDSRIVSLNSLRLPGAPAPKRCQSPTRCPQHIAFSLVFSQARYSNRWMLSENLENWSQHDTQHPFVIRNLTSHCPPCWHRVPIHSKAYWPWCLPVANLVPLLRRRTCQDLSSLLPVLTTILAFGKAWRRRGATNSRLAGVCMEARLRQEVIGRSCRDTCIMCVQLSAALKGFDQQLRIFAPIPRPVFHTRTVEDHRRDRSNRCFYWAVWAAKSPVRTLHLGNELTL